MQPFLHLLTPCEPFTSTDGQAFVRLPYSSGGRYILPIRSAAFRNWYLYQCFSQLESHPTTRQFHAVLDHLEAAAHADPLCQRLAVYRRVAYEGAGRTPDQILLDLANPQGQFVRISPGAWKTTAGPGPLLQTSRSTLPLPEPVATDDPAAALAQFRACLNLPSRAAWLRCLAWMLAALRPWGQYPILLLEGPPGSGKSFAARVLRSIIDPCASHFTPLPATARDLLTLARHNWILAFDHISTLSPPIADALCRISSGLGLAVRETFGPAPEPLQQFIRRPILLTVTDRFVCPPEISSRALIVKLPPLTAGPRPEDALAHLIEESWDVTHGALCTALGTALRRLPDIAPPAARCASALAWAMAASPDLGCTEDDLKLAFDAPPRPHPIVDAVRNLLDQRRQWTGTASELLDLLEPLATCRTAKGLSHQLRESMLTFADTGIELNFRRLTGGVRAIYLSGEASDASCKNDPSDASLNSDPPPQPQETEDLTA